MTWTCRSPYLTSELKAGSEAGSAPAIDIDDEREGGIVAQ